MIQACSDSSSSGTSVTGSSGARTTGTVPLPPLLVTAAVPSVLLSCTVADAAGKAASAVVCFGI